jgi:hypothetical protein
MPQVQSAAQLPEHASSSNGSQRSLGWSMMPLPQNGWLAVVRKTDSASGAGSAPVSSAPVTSRPSGMGSGAGDGAATLSGKSVIGRRCRNPLLAARSNGAFTTST